MSGEAPFELIKMLMPAGSATIIAGILAYRSPQLVKELFAGIGRLLVTIEKIRKAAGPT